MSERDPREARTIDAYGRCPDCLIKPLVYRRDRKLFCHRCCRTFDIVSLEQIGDRSMWLAQADGTFQPGYPTSEYVTAKADAATIRRARLTEAKTATIVTPPQRAG